MDLVIRRWSLSGKASGLKNRESRLTAVWGGWWIVYFKKPTSQEMQCSSLTLLTGTRAMVTG